ncbi:pyruvate phosphate dikinase, PEP/pyruvate binding domain-containing protein [Actinidia rufa]|uniref:Pyruvate phosphate dikinase, PEP/pyruvate binding domain-containing protein n=1 Tax=Actinidia rufa TaxID=165716 RepID=A0A7J0GE13_9ERIC|nr:pyruvate phosphate dikinase, PEP/pyruvate binding domain-containing protein [Actinidia rufa]
MILSTVGLGGEGVVGQRIRDEILVIQRNNDCKGGIMKEWQHNNSSPDDVVICQALIDHIKSDFDVSVYWKTLNENGNNKGMPSKQFIQVQIWSLPFRIAWVIGLRDKASCSGCRSILYQACHLDFRRLRTAIDWGYAELNSAKPEVYHPVSISACA